MAVFGNAGHSSWSDGRSEFHVLAQTDLPAAGAANSVDSDQVLAAVKIDVVSKKLGDQIGRENAEFADPIDLLAGRIDRMHLIVVVGKDDVVAMDDERAIESGIDGQRLRPGRLTGVDVECIEGLIGLLEDDQL